MLSAVIQAIGSTTTRPLMTVTVASSAIANPEVLKEKRKHSASQPTNVVFLVDQGAVQTQQRKEHTHVQAGTALRWQRALGARHHRLRLLSQLRPSYPYTKDNGPA